MSKLKMSYLCLLVMLVGVCLPTVFGKQNLLINGDFSGGAGTESCAANWIDYSPDGNINVETLDSVEAEPGKAPCLKINANWGSSGSNGHRFYQSVPVTPGMYYQFNGRWKGDLGHKNNSRHFWAEIFIGFGDNAVFENITPENFLIDYAFKYRYEWNDPGYSYHDDGPVGTFMNDGHWDWTDMLAGDDGGNNFGYDNFNGYIAPAGATHAFIAVNLGGSSDSDVSLGDITIYIDDLYILSCQPDGGNAFGPGDLNMDCVTDLEDLAMLSRSWLACNLDPVDDGSLGVCP